MSVQPWYSNVSLVHSLLTSPSHCTMRHRGPPQHHSKHQSDQGTKWKGVWPECMKDHCEDLRSWIYLFILQVWEMWLANLFLLEYIFPQWGQGNSPGQWRSSMCLLRLDTMELEHTGYTMVGRWDRLTTEGPNKYINIYRRGFSHYVFISKYTNIMHI